MDSVLATNNLDNLLLNFFSISVPLAEVGRYVVVVSFSRFSRPPQNLKIDKDRHYVARFGPF